MELVVEIGHGAQAADHDFATTRDDEIAQQAREAFGRHIGLIVQDLAHQVHALVQGEQGLLVVGCRHADDDPVKQLGSTAHHIAVPQGQGSKVPG